MALYALGDMHLAFSVDKPMVDSGKFMKSMRKNSKRLQKTDWK